MTAEGLDFIAAFISQGAPKRPSDQHSSFCEASGLGALKCDVTTTTDQSATNKSFKRVVISPQDSML